MKKLSKVESQEFLAQLKERFQNNMLRHQDVTWETIEEKLMENPEKLWSLQQMETSGGEPDVVQFDPQDKELYYVDCAPESPKERRNLCYDQEALEARKKFKPESSALKVATDMGIDLLNEEQYRRLQELGKFDQKTSSWIKTPERVRKLGGALFCDRRFDTVFVYHNGAESYYSGRGFRGYLEL